MKELEKIIIENKKEFDSFEPDNGHIERFYNKLNKKEKTNRIKMLKLIRVAALIIILISTALFGKVYLIDQKVIFSNGISLSEVSEEMAEVESYYLFNIEISSEILKDKLNSSPSSVRKDVYSTVKEMDKDYKLLKKELLQFSGNSKIISAMLDYYEAKSVFLDDVIKKISY